MPQYTNAIDLYRHQKRAFEEGGANGRTARQLWRQIPEGGFRDLKELTSGSLGPKQTRGSYARLNGGNARRFTQKSYLNRFGRNIAPRLPINRQSGRLNSSVTLYRRSSAYTLEESVGFDAGKAGKSILAVRPGGTRYVIDRNLWPEVRTRGRARNKAFVDVFFPTQRKAFSKP